MRDFRRSSRPDHRIAVFLDRDGTINEDTHYPYRVEQLRFLPGALDALTELADLPVLTVIVTNQAGIALGRYSTEQMHAFNAALIEQAGAVGARIDAIYYCPELEDGGDLGGLARSDCSKPQPGMLLEAAADLGVDLSSSIMIGDKKSDIGAGQRVGCHTILVLTGKAGLDEGPDIAPDSSAADLLEAVGLVRQRMIGTA